MLLYILLIRKPRRDMWIFKRIAKVNRYVELFNLIIRSHGLLNRGNELPTRWNELPVHENWFRYDDLLMTFFDNVHVPSGLSYFVDRYCLDLRTVFRLHYFVGFFFQYIGFRLFINQWYKKTKSTGGTVKSIQWFIYWSIDLLYIVSNNLEKH